MKTKSSSVKPTCTYVIQSRVGEQPEILCGNPVKYTYEETVEGGRVRVYDSCCSECASKPPRQEQIEEALAELAAMPDVASQIDLDGFENVVEDALSSVDEAQEAEEAYQEIVDNEMPPEVQKEVASPSQPAKSSEAKYDRWVKAVRLWAERHPKQNGGYITNCWTDAEIRGHLISQGVQTQKQATDEFYAVCQVNKEMAEEIQNA